MKRVLSLTCLLFPLILVGQWQTFTNTSEIRQFTIADSMLWSATNGGILRVNVNTLEYKKFTNTEGLAQIDVVAIAHSPNDQLWVAMPDGLLQIMAIESGEWDSYNEFQNEIKVNALMPHHDFVLVGFDKGIAELQLDAKNRWERTWKADIGAVNTILITGEHIWVGQQDGVRRIPLDFPNKQIPSAWERYSVGDGLPGNEINELIQFDGEIVAGTATGIGYFDGLEWSRSELSDHNVQSLCRWKEQLVIASPLGVKVRDQYGLWTNVGQAGANSVSVKSSSNDNLWLGTSDDGLHVWADTLWNPLALNCPNSNVFSDLLVDRDGHLWATSTKKPTGGVYYFNGTTWKNFTRPNGLATFEYHAIEEDLHGRIWAGSWGGGVTLFEKVGDDSITFTNLYSMDGNLSGVIGAENYVVITDIKSDEHGNLWFLNSDADDKRVLHVYDLEDRWQHWLATESASEEGIRSVKVLCLEIDATGRKWIGTGSSSGGGANGLSVLDDKGTPFDTSDDDLKGFLDETEGLESNHVTSLAEDQNGTMWIGTTKGLNYWYGTVGARYSVINDNIQALLVDPRNNTWIGTAGGLSVLEEDNFTWKHYTTSNSQIVSDFISCLAFDEETGELYIGTTNGLSRFKTPFTKPASNLNAVKGYPNPFIISEENPFYYIDNLTLNPHISIFTPDGYLVKTFPKTDILGARVRWDGTNNDGQIVASGIYVYLVTTKSGQSASGKIAFIKP
ncbi:hypothetical protein EH223_16050 [candidate division KSB1 bacterium]|nr:hypothetical protein [candidate division KSB1 bacterium]RQW01207.1 MAG: hypothetical protein EH223_16050 [candidate division KSB1 bacterium]